MIKTTISFKYAEILAIELEKHSGCEFLAVDCGDNVELVEQEPLTMTGEINFHAFVKAFELGVKINGSELDKIYGHLEKCLEIVNQI